MKAIRFSEEKIIGILKQQEAGRTVTEVCHEAGISQSTFSTGKPSSGD